MSSAARGAEDTGGASSTAGAERAGLRSGARGWITGRELVLVGVGGALGTLLRFAAGELLPWNSNGSTLAVNLVGALLLGAVTSLLAGRRPAAHLFLGTGVCGGFTTYSALAVGIAGLILTGQPWLALLLGLGTVLLGGVATAAGLWLGRAVLRSKQAEPRPGAGDAAEGAA